MRYSGRISLVFIPLTVSIIRYLIYGQINHLHLLELAIFIVIAWFVGGLVDKSRFYQKRAEKYSRELNNAFSETHLLLDQVQKSEERLRFILENSSDVITHTDTKGIYTFVSSTCQNILGYCSEELVGKCSMDFLHPEDLERISLLGIETRDSHDVAMFIHRFRKPNAQYIWVETTVRTLYDQQGQLDGFLSVSRDITDRKEAKEQLYPSNEMPKRTHAEIDRHQQYEQLLKLAPEAILLHRDGNVIYVNDNALKLFGGEKKEDLLDKHILDYIHPNDQEKIQKRIKKLMQTKKQLDFIEIQVYKLDGTLLDVEISSIHVYRQIHMPVIQTVIRDISERKKTEEYIRQSEKLAVVGQLAAGIAHEIRNPLTALKGFSQLIKARNDGNQGYITIMIDEINRINEIVNEFMILAKPHANTFETKRMSVTLENVLKLLETQSIMSNVDILFDIEYEESWVSCVEDQLKQVFINVIKNAIEAMEHGGVVKVVLKSITPQRVLIQVIDHGPGIPQDKLPNLGQPFYTTKEGGTGLGLMICYKIIETHQGKMRIESEPGKGTMVEICLPLAPTA